VRLVVTLDDVRTFAAGLPRSTEVFVQGRVKFRVGRIVYLAFSRDETVMGFAFPKEWREALVQSEPEKFRLPRSSDLRWNWVDARLEAIEPEEMRELVLDAWAMSSPGAWRRSTRACTPRSAAQPGSAPSGIGARPPRSNGA
jgi:hypothetical protein